MPFFVVFVSFFFKCSGGHVIYKREGKQILLRVSGRFESVLSSYQRGFELTRVELQSMCKGNRLSFELAQGSSY